MAALRCVEQNGLVERAAALGDRIKARLGPLVGRHGVADVRGNGLMIGVELRSEAGSPDYGRVTVVKAACREKGLLILTCGARIGVPAADNSTIRLLPPLSVTDDELDRGLTILSEALKTVGA
jgi:4-aminobutyrate aminotransferase-like enzyme